MRKGLVTKGKKLWFGGRFLFTFVTMFTIFKSMKGSNKRNEGEKKMTSAERKFEGFVKNHNLDVTTEYDETWGTKRTAAISSFDATTHDNAVNILFTLSFSNGGYAKRTSLSVRGFVDGKRVTRNRAFLHHSMNT